MINVYININGQVLLLWKTQSIIFHVRIIYFSVLHYSLQTFNLALCLLTLQNKLVLETETFEILFENRLK